MGKILVKTKIWNIFDEEKVRKGEISPLEVDALVDTGATLSVIPESIAQKLNLLRQEKKITVRYANGKKEEKEVAMGLIVEILNREGETKAIIEPQAVQVLIGQIVLEEMDLIPDPKNGKLIPRPESPNTPLIDIFSGEVRMGKWGPRKCKSLRGKLR